LPIGFGGPKRGFEAPLGGLPQGIRFTELGPSQAGQTDQPVAPVLRIDSDRDQLFAHGPVGAGEKNGAVRVIALPTRVEGSVRRQSGGAGCQN